VPEISDRQPATTGIRGKRLDFHIDNEEKLTPIELNLIPSQDLKPNEVITQSSDRNRKAPDTSKSKDKHVMAESSLRNKGNHRDSGKRSKESLPESKEEGVSFTAQQMK